MTGCPVQLADVNADATQRALTRLLQESTEFESQGLFPRGASELLQENLRAAASVEHAVETVDYVQEAVFELVEVKHDVLSRIERAARPDAIIGTNTSTIPVHVLAEALTDASRFLTVHWSNPAPFIPGIELVAGERTDPAVLAPVQEMITRAGRQSALVADVPGFVLNRLQYVLLKEAMDIVAEGVATPADVDTIVRTTFGYRLPFFGPFAIADMAGLDVYAGGFRVLERAFGERLAPPKQLTDLVAQGKYGVKTGSGFLELDEHSRKDLISYRNRAYSKMGELLRELGPSPLSEARLRSPEPGPTEKL